MLMRAATVVQVLQDLFHVLLHVLFYLWSLLNDVTHATHESTLCGLKLRSYFRLGRLWTKVHQLKQAYDAWEITVCNAAFYSMISCYVPEIFAFELRSCPKAPTFWCFGLPKFFGGGAVKFLRQFYKFTAEHVSEFGDDLPSDLGH